MTIFWVGFNLFVLAMLALDLGVFHRKSHEVKIKEALIWSAVWITLALCLNIGIYFLMGKVKALEFLTGYLIEKSLSIDNIFVFILIFSYFKIEPRYQHKILFWGIIGALVMRIALILLGVELLNRFHWIIYIFGLLLIATGIKMALEKGKEIHPEKNPVLRLFKRFMPVTDDLSDGKFLTRIKGKLTATPLLIVLIVVETTDLIFAVDSIPAILAISRDTFIIYSSNVMAILGLRALYFALAGIMTLFHYLHYGLSAILVFVGAKMMISELYKVPILVSLAVIALILIASIVASLLRPIPRATKASS
jgi:tellurite resistance protein TerC